MKQYQRIQMKRNCLCLGKLFVTHMKIMGVLPVILSKALNVDLWSNKQQCNEVLLYKPCFRREHEILMKVFRGDELTNNGSSELCIGLSESNVFVLDQMLKISGPCVSKPEKVILKWFWCLYLTSTLAFEPARESEGSFTSHWIACQVGLQGNISNRTMRRCPNRNDYLWVTTIPQEGLINHRRQKTK